MTPELADDELPTIYVVSLARAADRRSRMIDRLRSESLRFRIVEAYEATDPEVRKKVSGEQTDGALRIAACFTSHLRALKEFLETGDPQAVISEDDVRPRRGFARSLRELLDNVPDEAPLVSLGYLVWRWDGFLWSGKNAAKENLTTMGPDLWGTQMYLVRRTWAAECLDRFAGPLEQIETDQIRTSELITREARFRGGLVAYPPLAVEDLTGSIIDPAAGTANHPEVVTRWDSSQYVP